MRHRGQTCMITTNTMLGRCELQLSTAIQSIICHACWYQLSTGATYASLQPILLRKEESQFRAPDQPLTASE